VIVLDASVLIAHLDGSDRHHAKARRLLEQIAAHRWG
jgi:predicted nucleic acid-binding protein